MSTPDFPAETRPLWKDLLHPAVIVGALGYFVDIYDLLLFRIVRAASLNDLGLTGDEVLSVGIMLDNWQTAGLLIGGLPGGGLGDLRGRRSVHLGAIIPY